MPPPGPVFPMEHRPPVAHVGGMVVVDPSHQFLVRIAVVVVVPESPEPVPLLDFSLDPLQADSAMVTTARRANFLDLDVKFLIFRD